MPRLKEPYSVHSRMRVAARYADRPLRAKVLQIMPAGPNDWIVNTARRYADNEETVLVGEEVNLHKVFMYALAKLNDESCSWRDVLALKSSDVSDPLTFRDSVRLWTSVSKPVSERLVYASDPQALDFVERFGDRCRSECETWASDDGMCASVEHDRKCQERSMVPF